MTRRGSRSLLGGRRRMNRIWAGPNYGEALGAENRWDSRHAEGWTLLDAVCRECGEYRIDVQEQWSNTRHPDGRLRAEAIMLAVATYGKCAFCGQTEIDILTMREAEAAE